MFLSRQTYEGFKITVNSHVEAIKFLSEGFKYVLSERFMQDVIEDYFGHQRTVRGRSDNPSAQQFGYNDLTIAAKRDIAPSVSGNTGGRYGKEKWCHIFLKTLLKNVRNKSEILTMTMHCVLRCSFHLLIQQFLMFQNHLQICILLSDSGIDW